jgi:hypothetical protein
MCWIDPSSEMIPRMIQSMGVDLHRGLTYAITLLQSVESTILFEGSKHISHSHGKNGTQTQFHTGDDESVVGRAS